MVEEDFEEFVTTNQNKEDDKMPRGNGTGPAGAGPMTGRAMGLCAGYAAPGYANPGPGRGFGYGRGRGFGFGGGQGMGFRGGRGSGFWGAPYAAPYAAPAGAFGAAMQPYAGPAPEQETELLKSQVTYFEDALENVRKRIAELEAKTEAKK